MISQSEVRGWVHGTMVGVGLCIWPDSISLTRYVALRAHQFIPLLGVVIIALMFIHVRTRRWGWDLSRGDVVNLSPRIGGLFEFTSGLFAGLATVFVPYAFMGGFGRGVFLAAGAMFVGFAWLVYGLRVVHDAMVDGELYEPRPER